VKCLIQRIASILRRDEGSNVIEMMLSSTVLFAMIFGICQMSIALYIYHFTSDAARQGSRYAMVRGNTSCINTPSLKNCNATASQIQTWVRGLNYPGITSSKLTVTTTWCSASSTTPTTWSSCSGTTSNAPGNVVKVYVSYPLAFQIPFSKNTSLTLSSTSQMVISQ
jgi:Flp pilus assembly protein TadG